MPYIHKSSLYVVVTSLEATLFVSKKIGVLYNKRIIYGKCQQK